MTTKILALTDSLGCLVRFILLPGQRFDSIGVPPLIDGIDFDGLIADKAFDSNSIIAELNERGAKIVISQHPRRTKPLPIDTEIHKWRHLWLCQISGTEPHTWRADQMDNITFVGLDVHKATVCAEVAETGRGGEVRQVGVFENRPEILSRMVTRLSKGGRRLSFCYEAGPCGYGLQRLPTGAGHECVVVAPSLIPIKTGLRHLFDCSGEANHVIPCLAEGSIG